MASRNGHHRQAPPDEPETIFEAYVSYVDEDGTVRWEPSNVDHGEAETLLEGVEYTDDDGRTWIGPLQSLPNQATVICDPPPVEVRRSLAAARARPRLVRE